jgi:hypothetical protein
MLWVVALESIIITVLLPGNWTTRVIEQEAELLAHRLGAEESRWVHDKARNWYNSSLIENGFYSAVHNHLIPTEQQKTRSTGMRKMGSSWFSWVEARVQSAANAYYHVLTRFALFMTWSPYFLILLIPAVFDGLMTWRIKRTNFAYASPLLHRLSGTIIVYVFIGLVALFLAPIVLDPIVIPASIMISCVMAGLLLGNMQKRI